MKRFFAAALFIGLCMALCACGSGQVRQIQRADTAMGTVIQQKLYTVSDTDDAAEEIDALLRELESGELSWRLETSEVYRINASAGAEEGVSVSESFAALLERCLEISGDAGDAFDVTLGPVVRLWDLDSWASGERTGEFVPPDGQALEEALARCGSGRLRLDGENGRLYLPEGMSLDLGAVGKGIALDRILEYLQEQDEITGATVSVGGSVLTYGEKPDGAPWRVGIVNPQKTSENMGILSLEGQWCVSTSGDYERYVEADGVRYHHIIDPVTGYPADSGVAGVTVLTKDGFLSDALSTACFILGSERGMKLAETYGAEVLFVEKDGSITMSEGMRAVYTESLYTESH